MIGVIGAMPEEIELIKKNMSETNTQTIGSMQYHIGKIYDEPVVLCLSGIGKVNAAAAATILIHVFKAQILIFTGVAGGVQPHLNIGDIVIGTDFLYHDFDAQALGYAISEIPDEKISLFPANTFISETVLEIAREAFGNHCIHPGRIVSGDQFIANNEKITFLREQFNAFAVDMESAAVAHIAYKHNVPCCIIRSISDKADSEASSTYDNFFAGAAQKSSYIVMQLIKQSNFRVLFNEP